MVLLGNSILQQWLNLQYNTVQNKTIISLILGFETKWGGKV